MNERIAMKAALVRSTRHYHQGQHQKFSLYVLLVKNSSRGYCLTPATVPYCLYLDQFVFDSCGPITYILVFNFYRYGSHLQTGHFNCILFKRDETSCSNDDTNKTLYDTEVVLRDPERQEHTYIAIYVQEKFAGSHFCSIYDNLPWSYDGSEKEVVENVYCQSNKLMDELSERDMLKTDKLNSDVIKAETVTPLLPHILLNISKAEERNIL